MKKTISLVLVMAFIFALATNLSVLAENTATSSDATSTPVITSSEASTTPELKIEPVKEIVSSSTPSTTSLEKIPSPTSINLFERIKKVGNDLFGIRKATSTIIKIEGKKATTTNLVNKKIEEIKKAGLEKITSLEQVKLFDKITKVGNDLFGVKKLVAKVLPVMSADLITCASSAIDAKDTKASELLTTNASEIATAVATRGTCQKAALNATTERQGAINACNKAFQLTTKTTNDKSQVTQKNIWETYKTSLKTCATTASTTEINIEDGGNILK